MNILRKLSTSVLVAGLAALPALRADAKPMRVPVTSIGSGTDVDKSAAMSAAKDNAESMLVCAGTVEGLKTTSTGCTQTGSSYVCAAVSSATCVLGS